MRGANRANDRIGNSLLVPRTQTSEQPIAKILETKFRTKYWKISFGQQRLLSIDKTYTYTRTSYSYPGPVRLRMYARVQLSLSGESVEVRMPRGALGLYVLLAPCSQFKQRSIVPARTWPFTERERAFFPLGICLPMAPVIMT